MATPENPPIDLSETLSTNTQAFLQPSNSLYTALVESAKAYLEPLASDIAAVRLERQQLERQSRKRKRRSYGEDAATKQQLLRTKRIYSSGFAAEQVWQQAARILDAAKEEAELTVPAFQPEGRDSDQDAQELADGSSAEGAEMLVDDTRSSQEYSEQDWQDMDDSDESMDSEADETLQDDNAHTRRAKGRKDTSGSSSNIGSETPPSHLSESDDDGQEYVPDKHGLNDTFFSIDDFNKQTQFLEQQDARGDPDDGAASDEEDVDWEIDPLAEGALSKLQPSRNHASSRRDRKEEEVEDEEDKSDDDGPTFGNADLNAPDSNSEDEYFSTTDGDFDNMGLQDFSNTNDIGYEDFFPPPRRKKPAPKRHGNSSRPTSATNSQKPSSRLLDENGAAVDDEEAQIQRAMSSLQQEFESDSEGESGAADNGNSSAQKKKKAVDDPKLSTHERRQAAFRAEIERLERENVAAKPWSLTGETVAPARPENALLEEDLDFERAGKPLPVITAEMNESIESLIKRRILSAEFDEVSKRRPELDSVRRGIQDPPKRKELSNERSSRGLADEYADDYLRSTDPNYVDSRSAATKAVHDTIAAQWKSICAQLDALSNWHYKPQPPEESLEVRANVPVVRMEDARPAGSEGANVSALAPQEVYTPGKEPSRTRDEIRTIGGTAVAREEDTRESRRRRRTRDKARARKAAAHEMPEKTDPPHTQSSKKASTTSKSKGGDKTVERQLKTGGVKIIGKRGELQGMDGSAVKTSKPASTPANMRL